MNRVQDKQGRLVRTGIFCRTLKVLIAATLLLCVSTTVHGQGGDQSLFDPALSDSGSDWFGFHTPIRVGLHGGKSYAEPSEFFSIDVMRPFDSTVESDGSELIRYLDARLGLSFEGGSLINVGIGQRHYLAGPNLIVDANIWYDADGSRNRTFQQITAGGQVQSDLFIGRGHYYLPVGSTKETAGFTPLTGNVGYTGNILALERFRIESQAYEGFDAEIGVTLPSPTLTQLFVGYYNFHADQAEDLTGFTATLVTEPVESLQFALQVTVDDEEDTNILGSATYEFSSVKRNWQRPLKGRLGDFARRNRHIVSRETRVYAPIAATALNGNDFNIIHASSAGSSDGTFESPYSDLSQAAADAAATPDSIVLLHADSVFDSQNVVLPEQTRFLSETLNHTVVTEQLGQISLPRATMGTAMPVLENARAFAPALTLADNLEVNGLIIRDAGGVGIFGNNLSQSVVLRNTVVDGAGIGVQIKNADAALSFDPIQVSNATEAGVRIEDTAATGALTFADVTVDSSRNGLEIVGSHPESTISFDGPVTITNSSNNGIDIRDNSDDSFLTFNGPTTVNTAGGSGVRISNLNEDPVALSDDINFVGTLSISNTTGTGVHLEDNGSNVGIKALQLTNWMGRAIALERTAGHFTVENPLVLDNTLASPDSTIFLTGSTSEITFGDVTITDTAGASGDAPVVQILENDSGVHDVIFQKLNITSVNRTALFGTETGSNFTKLVVQSGDLTTTGAPAIDLDGLSTDVTFQSVNVMDTPVGIRLVRLGQRSAFHDKFQIVGDGVAAGSGGSMSGVDRGVVLTGSNDVSLNRMSIESTISGVEVSHDGFNQSQRLTVADLSLGDAGGSDNWVGIDVQWDRGAHFKDSNFLRDNVINGSGLNQTGIRVRNTASNPEMLMTIEGNSIDLSGGASDGIVISATGFVLGQVTNLGGIDLSGTTNNSVNVTGQPFTATEAVDAQITGRIIVNDVEVP